MGGIIFSGNIPGVFAEEVLLEKNFSMTNCHFHETIELLFLLESERNFFIEQDIYHVKPGMALLINRNQLHKGSMISNNAVYHRFLLQLDASVLDDFFSLPEIPNVQSFGDKYWGIAEFSQGDWLKTMTIIDMLKDEIYRNDLTGNSNGLLLVMQLMILFIRNRKQQRHLFNDDQPADHEVFANHQQTVYEISLYLQNHSNEPCYLDDIAAYFYISRSHLTRIFKSVTGFTVTEYLSICRIQKAKILLDETNLSITKISTITGFGNVTYFERIFKRMTDLTPLQYRNRKCR